MLDSMNSVIKFKSLPPARWYAGQTGSGCVEILVGVRKEGIKNTGGGTGRRDARPVDLELDASPLLKRRCMQVSSNNICFSKVKLQEQLWLIGRTQSRS